MIVLALGCLAWFVGACGLGVLIGRAIRLADRLAAGGTARNRAVGDPPPRHAKD